MVKRLIEIATVLVLTVGMFGCASLHCIPVCG